MQNSWNELVLVLVVFLQSSLAGLLPQSAPYKDRTGYQVLRIRAPDGIEEVTELVKRHLQEEEWLERNTRSQYVDVMVSREEGAQLKRTLRNTSLEHSVLIEDVEQRIQRHVTKRGTDSGQFNYQKFNSFESIEKELHRLAEENPDLAKLTVLGSTYEGRSVYLLRITHNITETPEKPVILIDAGIHAREWISVSTVLHMIYELTSSRGAIKGDLLDAFEFAFIPVLNPDGYVETWTGDRMWRKNKSPNNGTWCNGVDLNRNWDFQWGGEGTSSDPCAQDYRGVNAFSEKETAGIRDWVAKNRDHILVYINFHSYGQLWMTPFGYSVVTPINEMELMKYGNVAVEAIQSFSGTQYILGPVYTTIYPASSISVDWMSGDQRIPIAFTVELPDKGSHGFLVTERHVKPVGEETWIGVETMALQLANDKALF